MVKQISILCTLLCLGYYVGAQIQFGGQTGNGRPSNDGGTNRGRNNQRNRGNAGSRSGCVTVSGPNPGQPCVFPFTHQGTTYNGCPIDPDDRSKRWCSTRTDGNGNHVGGQNQYGHCGSNCPIFSETQQSSRTTQGSCSASDKCRSIVACSVQIRDSRLSQQACSQENGSQGLCCPDITTSKNNVGLRFSPSLDLRGVSEQVVTRSETQQALEIATSFFANVTRSQPSAILPRGSASYTHFRLQKAREGTSRTQRLAVIAMEAARRLRNDGKVASDTIVLRGADTENSILSDCYAPTICNPGKSYRNIDGSCNNLAQPLQGKLLTPLGRILPNAYSDGMNMPRVSSNGKPLKSPRLVSRLTGLSEESFSRQFTAIFMTWAQFVDHDLAHVPVQESGSGEGINCCTPNGGLDFDKQNDVSCFPIEIPSSDPVFNDQCMNFVRSQSAPNLDCAPSASEQTNQITHWLDSSNVYGSEDEEALHLRSQIDGLLRTDFSPNNKELLPTNPNESDCKGNKACFLAGDGRVNEQPNLAVIHTIFLREHNRVARLLKQINPRWSDNQLYQEAKRVVNAEWQHIVYNEFLPVLLGQQYMSTFGLWPLNSGFSSDYRSDFDARITNEFASAAYRVGHTMIPSLIKFIAQQRRSRDMNLSELFFNVDAIREGQIDDLIRGMIQTRIENVDNSFTPEITEKLFDGALNGMDLVAINIQRARDHGVPSYVEYRKICLVGNARTFEDLSNVISRQNIQLLKKVYDRVEDVDLFIGMVMERPHSSGALVGETFLCLIGDQFARLKKGDRFFYDLQNQAGSFTLSQLNEIRRTSLARLLCDNSDSISEIQPLAFRLPDSSTGQVCPASISSLCLQWPWRRGEPSTVKMDQVARGMPLARFSSRQRRYEVNQLVRGSSSCLTASSLRSQHPGGQRNRHVEQAPCPTRIKPVPSGWLRTWPNQFQDWSLFDQYHAFLSLADVVT